MQSLETRFFSKPFFMLAAACLLFVSSTHVLSYGNKSTEPKQAVYFIEPQDNATVAQEFKVVMGIKGMEIRPAGDMTEDSGHHHLFIDEEPMNESEVIPSGSPTHLHFGNGQTETMVTLKPGKHILMLQFANGAHQSYGESLRASITVNVK